MNKIPVFAIDLYKSTVRHIENMCLQKILNFEVRNHVICELIYWYRAKTRRAFAKALTKGQVSGTGKKPFAQKGRGIARQGSLKNPHQRGGGTAFSPTGRKYIYKMNKKKKYLALQSIIVTRLRENRIKVVEDFHMKKPSTQTISLLLHKLKLKKVLFIDDYNPSLTLSIQNILSAKFMNFRKLNIFELVLFPYILITKYVFSRLLIRFFPQLLR